MRWPWQSARKGSGAYLCDDHPRQGWIDEYDWNSHIWAWHAKEVIKGGSVFAKWRRYTR